MFKSNFGFTGLGLVSLSLALSLSISLSLSAGAARGQEAQVKDTHTEDTPAKDQPQAGQYQLQSMYPQIAQAQNSPAGGATAPAQSTPSGASINASPGTSSSTAPNAGSYGGQGLPSAVPGSDIGSTGGGESLDRVDAPPLSTPIQDANTSTSTGLRGEDAVKPQDVSGLTPTRRREDYEVINTQAESFRQRFLQGEAIELRLPMGPELMPLSPILPPIRLEASYTQPISLRETVQYCIDNNLDIRISQEQVNQAKWVSVGSFGRFLPDALMQYRSLFQAGSTLIGGTIPITFANPFVTVSAGYRFYGFRGGSVMFGALSNLHNFRAQRQQYHATINDALVQVTRNYYELVRNQALLQIQTRAVDVSKAQVDLNRQLEKAGTGTRFQVLQSETQLARDEQSLLTQEVDLRRSAINLSTNLNLNSGVNLLSVENEVRKVRLFDPNIDINRLINIAVSNRPELKQFEQLRIAAKRNIQVQAAPLYPQFQFFGQLAGNGQTLTHKYTTSAPSFTIAPLNSPASTQQILAIRNGLGGAAVAPSTVPAVAVYNPPAVVNRQVRQSYQIGVQLDWNYNSLGVPDLANIQAARAQARQANLRVNKTIMDVYQQVRESYLQSQTAERQIEVATKEVLSSAEELRLARVRLANGVGTNIDVINAQRDFTQALVRKADAIIQFNILQAQLLRDVGIISYDTLTSGRLVK